MPKRDRSRSRSARNKKASELLRTDIHRSQACTICSCFVFGKGPQQAIPVKKEGRTLLVSSYVNVGLLLLVAYSHFVFFKCHGRLFSLKCRRLLGASASERGSAKRARKQTTIMLMNGEENFRLTALDATAC